jgi:acetyl esterase/lipase
MEPVDGSKTAIFILMLIVYGALADGTGVPKEAPPIFIASAADDALSRFSLDLYSAWRAASLPAEIHIFQEGGHGFGFLHQGKAATTGLSHSTIG